MRMTTAPICSESSTSFGMSGKTGGIATTAKADFAKHNSDERLPDATAAAVKTKNRCRFLELPVELRLMIYKILLVDEDDLTIHEAYPAGVKRGYIIYIDRKGRKNMRLQAGRLWPNILATNQLIHQEAREILYSQHLHFTSLTTLRVFVEQIGRCKSDVRNISIFLDYKVEWWKGMAYYFGKDCCLQRVCYFFERESDLDGWKIDQSDQPFGHLYLTGLEEEEMKTGATGKMQGGFSKTWVRPGFSYEQSSGPEDPDAFSRAIWELLLKLTGQVSQT